MDFISVVVGCAPDRFPHRAWVPVDERLDLEKAFVLLNDGMVFVRTRVSNPETLAHLTQLLDEAQQAYRTGNRKRGSHLIQDFEEAIRMATRKRP